MWQTIKSYPHRHGQSSITLNISRFPEMIGNVMQCSKCRYPAVVFQPYSGQYLCRDHFVLDFEAKAKREIRKNRWMRPGDHIAVALTGSPGEGALLHFLSKLAANRTDLRISAVQTGNAGRHAGPIPAGPGYTRLARATSLEERAASLLTSILAGRGDRIITGDRADCGGIPEIFPFCHIPAEEILLYARIHDPGSTGSTPAPEPGTLEGDVRALLDGYTRNHPGAPHAVLNLCDSLAGTLPDPDRPGRAGHEGASNS